MALVLGIDAAWTVKNCSGVALLHCSDRGNNLIAAAPSYKTFIQLANGVEINWHTGVADESDVPRLIECASRLGKAKVGEAKVDVVSVDMPMSFKPITGRREADRKVSKAFGARGASVHSPNADRPGRCGEYLAKGFFQAGYKLATRAENIGSEPHLIEVFPLAALVSLMDLPFRPQYKVTKQYSKWRGLTQEQRLNRIYEEWQKILDALTLEICSLEFKLPERALIRTAGSLKPYEDALDAIICAWVGACFLRGHAEPLGDDDAAIWIPSLSASPKHV